jgi:monoamine oxidase
MKHTSDEDLLEAAMSSLASIFKMDTDSLKGLLISWKVINWTADPYARGSYTYATVDTELARKVLMTPIDDTLYFAGEALYDGAEMGTVEAALDNGKRVAEGILDRL